MESQAKKKKSKSKRRSSKNAPYRKYQPPTVGPHWGGKSSGFVDLNFSGEINSAGTLSLVATVPQGPGTNQRIGRRIAWKSCFIRGAMSGNTTALANKVAIMLVYDKQVTQSGASNVLPLITDILAGAHPSALNNAANLSRFRILMRKDYVLFGGVPATVPAAGGNLLPSSGCLVDEMVDLKGKEVEYKAVSSGDGTIGDFVSGPVYVVMIGSQPTGTTSVQANIWFRTRFIDVQG